MSTKARELRKRLKQKEEAENEKDKPAVKLKTSQTFQEGKNNKMLFKGGIKDRDSYIDPLEYFKKEHLIIKEDKMDEYALDDDDLEEGGNKDERPKTKGGIMMMGMPMPMGGQKGGMGFKINFEEMMTMVVRALEIDKKVAMNYSDWPIGYMNAAQISGLLKNVEYNYSNDSASRGETAIVIKNALDYIESKNKPL